MVKVSCLECGGVFYLRTDTIDTEVPKDVKTGEAFPVSCPHCEDGRFAVLM